MADMLIDINKLDVDTAEKAKAKAMQIMEKYKNAKDIEEKYIEVYKLGEAIAYYNISIQKNCRPINE